MPLIDSFAEFLRFIAGILWTATYIHQSILHYVNGLIHVRAANSDSNSEETSVTRHVLHGITMFDINKVESRSRQCNKIRYAPEDNAASGSSLRAPRHSHAVIRMLPVGQKSLKDNCTSASKKSELDEADSVCSRPIVVTAQVHQGIEETTENHKKFEDPFVTLNMPGMSNCYETEPEYEQIKYESFDEINNVDYDEINVMDSDYSDSLSYNSVSDVTIIEMQKADMSDDGYYLNNITNAERTFDPIYWISNHQEHTEYVTMNPTNDHDVDTEHKQCSCGSCLWSCFKKI